MPQTIDDKTFKMLEQLTEANPPQFMIQLRDFDTGKLTIADKHRLQYLKARALITMNQIPEAENLALELLSAAVEHSDHTMIAKCNLVLVKCYSRTETIESAISYLDVAYEAARNSGDNKIVTEVLLHYGTHFQSRNDKASSIKYLAMAEKLCPNLTDSDIVMQVKIALGTTHYLFGEHHKALAYMTAAFQMALDTQDVNRQLLIINNLSTLYSILLLYEDAVDTLNQGIRIADKHQFNIRKVQLLFNLGVLHLRRDQYQQSLDKLTECDAFAIKIGFDDPKYKFELYNNLAGACRYLKKYQEARNYLEQAEAIAIGKNDPALAKEIEVNKANLLLVMGETEEARKLLEECRKYFRKQGKFNQLIVSQMNLAEYYERRKEYPKAIKLLKEVAPLYAEHLSKLLDAKSEEHDREFKNLLSRFDEVRDNYEKLTSRLTNRFLGEFVGQSPHHRKVLETALLAAQHPVASVLLTGESGTGKEVLANLIHLHSARSNGPFVAVNVSAITSGLMESEFFGHRKGAFTGAISDHKGFFQQAQGGTLFLDEIGEMPKELQSKLLRVLESRKVTPVGSGTEISIDCRVISSTNRDLEDMLKDNLFRLDLFHRLNTIEIHIPPLRRRVEDIKPLIEHFIKVLARHNNRRTPTLDSSFINQMKQYSFPGNVRELRNLLERLFILCPKQHWDDSVLTHLPIQSSNDFAFESPISLAQAEMEKQMIITALRECGGKQKDAARALNISESTLTRRIARYKLEIHTRKGKQTP